MSRLTGVVAGPISQYRKRPKHKSDTLVLDLWILSIGGIKRPTLVRFVYTLEAW
jgi:hypothetical protein